MLVILTLLPRDSLAVAQVVGAALFALLVGGHDSPNSSSSAVANSARANCLASAADRTCTSEALSTF